MSKLAFDSMCNSPISSRKVSDYNELQAPNHETCARYQRSLDVFMWDTSEHPERFLELVLHLRKETMVDSDSELDSPGPRETLETKINSL
jgi:hypothetical protein